MDMTGMKHTTLYRYLGELVREGRAAHERTTQPVRPDRDRCQDGGHLPDPAEFAVAAEQAASSKAASVMSAHTAEQIISVVTVQAADRSAAVAVALAVVSEALKASGRVAQPLSGRLWPTSWGGS
jgi:hypothetical protein